MAKMKFYLNIEGVKLRTLDDLRENFFADSVLAHYQSGKLAQWLDVWNYKDELEQVRAIQATEVRDVLSELLRIFRVETDLEKFEVGVSVEDYLVKKDLKRQKEEEIETQAREEMEAQERELERQWELEHQRELERQREKELEPQRQRARERATEIIREFGGVNAKNKWGNTALMFEVDQRNPDLDVIKALIEAGADINAKTNMSHTALTYAICSSEPNLDVIKALIVLGADVNVNRNTGITPLMRFAARNNPNIDILKALVDAGADVNANDGYGSTAFDYATNDNMKALLRLFGGQSGR